MFKKLREQYQNKLVQVLTGLIFKTIDFNNCACSLRANK